MKNRSVQILMSIGVACLATTSPLVAASYNNSFGFDFTAAADPVQPAYLDDGTEIDVSPMGDREFSADGTWMGTGGELDFTILNLPSGKYDIAVGGDGPYSGGMSFQVSCGGNGYTSDYSHDGLFISDFEVTAGEPLHVVGVAGYAIAYIGGIGLYGPKMCDPPNIVTQPASQSVGMGGAVTFSVEATGCDPLSYQWLFNGVAIPGATDSSYTINSAQPGNTGRYRVVVANTAGSVTSADASLKVDLFRKVVVNASYGYHQWGNAQGTVDRAPAGWEAWLGGNNGGNNQYNALNINPPSGEAFIRQVVDLGFSVIDNYGQGNFNDTGNYEDAGYYALKRGACAFCYHSAPNSRHAYDYHSPPYSPFPGRGPCPMAIVAGGGLGWGSSANAYGPQGEFIDATCYSDQGNTCGCSYNDTAQSWAHNAVAAKYATVRDAHPDWNPFDIREYMRQVSTFYNQTWTDPATSHVYTGWRPDGGYGYSQIALRCGGNPIGTPVPTGLPSLPDVTLADLDAGPPLLPWLQVADDMQSIAFHWKSWLQTGFHSTVIKKTTDGIEAHAVVVHEETDPLVMSFTLTTAISGNETFYFYTTLDNGKQSRTEVFTILKLMPPQITSQPQSQSVPRGTGMPSFSVVATSTDPANPSETLSYQWYHDGVAIPNANYSTLYVYFPGTSQAGVYTVKVSSRFGSVFSSPATLTVTPNGWVYDTGGGLGSAVYEGGSPALAADGTIYFGAGHVGFFALNHDGTKKWSVPAPTGYSFSDCAPTIGDNGAVYTGATDGNLYAFDANGNLLWQTHLGTFSSSPSIGADGTIYCSAQGLAAVRPTDGHVLWTFPVANSRYSSPAIALNGTIYFGGMDGHLYAVNGNGSGLWTYPASGAIGAIKSSPAIGVDGSIYFGSEDGYVYCLNPNGTQKWSVLDPDGDIFESSPAIGTDGTVYIGTTGGSFYALDPQTGDSRWSSPYWADSIYSAPVVGSDGVIYLASYDILQAINPDGSTRWMYAPGDYVFSSPALGTDGTVYFATYSGLLHAIPSSSTPANSPWSMFKGNVRHTGLQPFIPRLVDMQFGDDAMTYVKTGFEATGVSSSDHWNYLSTDKGGGSFSLSHAPDVNGLATAINIDSSGDTQTGSWYTSSDNLFNGFLYSGGGGDFQVNAYLPPGTYNLYVYNSTVYTTTVTVSIGSLYVDSANVAGGHATFSVSGGVTYTLNFSSSSEPVCNGLQMEQTAP